MVNCICAEKAEYINTSVSATEGVEGNADISNFVNEWSMEKNHSEINCDYTVNSVDKAAYTRDTG